MIRNALPPSILATAIVVAGCGGGGGNSTSVPAPVSKSTSPGGVVTAQGTAGLVGPSVRSTAQKLQFDDKSGKIPPSAKGKTDAQKKHAVAGQNDCPGSDQMPSNDNIDQLNAAILCLVNLERSVNGNLPNLKQNGQLAQAAQGMCQRMITEHFFSHETPDGKTVVDRIQPTGYIPKDGDWVVGENLAWGSGALSTPQAIVNGWMNSEGHRANILAPDYKDIGLAACNGAPLTTVDGGTVYVNNFGAQSGADVTATLPGHEGTAKGASAAVAGAKQSAATRKARAKRRAACVRRAKRAKSSSRRKAAVSRCRARYAK